MGKINLKNTRINISAPVGVLTEAKIKKIEEEFVNGDFQILNQIQNQILFLGNPETGTSLLIASSQISVGFEGAPDFDWAFDSLTKVFNAMLLDSVGSSAIHIIGHVESEGSAMDSSLGFTRVQASEIKAAYPSLAGVGLRFIEKHGDDIWEFKVEPLLKDEKFYHIEGVFNYKEKNDLKVITENAKAAYTYYTTTLTELAERLFVK
ncbi:hypothetical protein [Anaerospora hongkongensis]|uniref:hypothetical protein n=1 Tax=Anaerospora hongkongensis TaxID=244830 RepID=UPI002FD979EA